MENENNELYDRLENAYKDQIAGLKSEISELRQEADELKEKASDNSYWNTLNITSTVITGVTLGLMGFIAYINSKN